MKLVSVIVEREQLSLSRPYTYIYEGNDKLEERFRVLIPFGKKILMGFVIAVVEDNRPLDEIQKDYKHELKSIYKIVDEEPLLTDEMMELASKVADYYLSPLISVLFSMLPKSLSPKTSSLKGPKIAYEKWIELLDPSEEGCTDKQIELLRMLARLGSIPKREAPSVSALNNLVKAHKVAIVAKEKQRFIIPEQEKEVPHEMTSLQREAYEKILNATQDVVLLQGVTGSGKTEVYLRLSEEVLNRGKDVLMLVPEINLTPVMVEYFSRRFGEKIAILHSGLTDAQKYDEYRRIKSGGVRIVVGARSAVFAPLSNIGLIIIDEEHTESYKQEEKAPFYHARDVAIMRSQITGAKVVLGSATPSLESKVRAEKGIYGLARLDQRVHEQKLPTVEIIDMREVNTRATERHIFSSELIDKIQEKLDKKEQCILLINRRGYSSYIGCKKCGFVYECPSCHIPLTYHKEDRLLKCHHCGYVVQAQRACPECGEEGGMHRIGFGTERVVKEVKEKFPEAKVERLDSDVSKNPQAAYKLLKGFKEKEFDILVGTQMIAKGHDFPNVTLVGDVLADIGLNIPSYRAAERSFGLIAQAVGRAGRASKEGEALIQTYSPSNYAITFGAKQNYDAFFAREMQNRKAFHYPPYRYLILIKARAKSEEKAAETIIDLKHFIEDLRLDHVEAIGPRAPYFQLINDVYVRELLVKFKEGDTLIKKLKEILPIMASKSGVNLTIERDPIDC